MSLSADEPTPMLPTQAPVSWTVVDDRVMGGVSRSRIEDSGDGTLRFAGVMSLANNGGFASVRTLPTRSDGQTGSFELEVAWIRGYGPDEDGGP